MIYKVVGQVTLEVAKLVEADSEKEAEELCEELETEICIHGSELDDGLKLDNPDFVLTDGAPISFPTDLYATEEVDIDPDEIDEEE